MFNSFNNGSIYIMLSRFCNYGLGVSNEHILYETITSATNLDSVYLYNSCIV